MTGQNGSGLRAWGCTALCAIAAGWATPGTAADITFGVLNPHEYDLPTNGYRPFDVAIQYTEFNNGSVQYDDSGHRTRTGGPDLFVGLTKLVHFWTFDNLPDVGFAYEVIQPEVHISGTGIDKTGFGDTLTGPAIWYKPTGNTTVGIQSFVSIPDGNTSVTNNFWASYTSMLFDVEIKKHVSVTGDFGRIFRGRQIVRNGPNVDPGDRYHANVRLTYRSKSKVEPFFAFDWQKNKTSRLVGGEPLPLTEGHDTAVGAGALVALSKTFSLTARYERSIDGRNITATNALYATLVKVFP